MPTTAQNSIELFNSGTSNFAHRGYTANAPENTLAAIQAAIDLSADGVEFDVRTCKSGEVVVFHDASLERMTNGAGMVRDMTLSELKQFKLKQGDKETGEVIPTLQEALELIDGRIAMNIEIKADFLPEKHQVEEKVIDLVKKFDIEKQTIVSSFHPLTVRKLKKVDDTILNGFLFDKNFFFRHYIFAFTRLLGAKAMHMEGSIATTNFVKRVLSSGYNCLVWTVNSPELMKRLINDGVHAIITDRPDLLKEIKMSGSYV